MTEDALSKPSNVRLETLRAFVRSDAGPVLMINRFLAAFYDERGLSFVADAKAPKEEKIYTGRVVHSAEWHISLGGTVLVRGSTKIETGIASLRENLSDFCETRIAAGRDSDQRSVPGEAPFSGTTFYEKAPLFVLDAPYLTKSMLRHIAWALKTAPELDVPFPPQLWKELADFRRKFAPDLIGGLE